MRDSVERPGKFAGADVVGADIAGGRGQSLRIAATDDEEVFVNNSRAGQRDGLGFGIASQIFAQIDAAVFAEGWDWLSSVGVEGVHRIHHAGEDAFFFSVGPVGQAAGRLPSVDGRIELPKERAGGRVQGDYFL